MFKLLKQVDLLQQMLFLLFPKVVDFNLLDSDKLTRCEIEALENFPASASSHDFSDLLNGINKDRMFSIHRVPPS
jgi:hypothetical protein